MVRPCSSLPNNARQQHIKIRPERDSHGEPPSFATLNQTLADSEIPSPSRALRALVSEAKRSRCGKDLTTAQNGDGMGAKSAQVQTSVNRV